MMKNSLKKLLLGGAAVLALGVGADAYAQATDTDQIDTTATIVAGIDVVAVADLDFGSFVPDAGGDTVTIDGDAAGARAAGLGTTYLVTTDAGSSGQFTISADQDTVFEISATVTDLTGPGAAMSLTNVTVSGGDGATTTGSNIEAAAVGGFSTTTTGAAETFYVGGTLNVNAAQVAGDYTGTLDLTAAYQESDTGF